MTVLSGAGRGALLFSICILAVLAYAAFEVNTGFTTRARLFANVIVVPALGLALIQTIRVARRQLAPPIPADAVTTRPAFIWGMGFFVSLAVVGLHLTIPAFAIAYLRVEAREAWPRTVLYAALAWLFVEATFVRTLHIALPAGLIPLPGTTQ